ncbi:hypothetical protein PIB30_093839, partial [Stylosanthes scabra]|nr:hypothetical protein [Stylosanthes scabra]
MPNLVVLRKHHATSSRFSTRKLFRGMTPTYYPQPMATTYMTQAFLATPMTAQRVVHQEPESMKLSSQVVMPNIRLRIWEWMWMLFKVVTMNH